MRSELLIGITGGIASGKSTASHYLKSKGYTIIDADQLGHLVLEDEAFDEVIHLFGAEIVLQEKTIDRKKLASIVFDNPDALQQLNAICWFHIEKRIEKQICNKQKNRLYFLDAALLIEAGWHHKCNEIWLVHTPIQQVFLRMKQRNQWSETEILQRIHSQPSFEERQPFATHIIDNSKSLQHLTHQIDAFLTHFPTKLET